jgi:hypothetical protein
MGNLNFRKIKLMIVMACIVLFEVSVTCADPVTLTNTWSSGDTLNAADLNQNFTDTKNAVDDNYSRISGKQDLLTNSCAPGSSIRAIAPNGNITCQLDTDTDTLGALNSCQDKQTLRWNSLAGEWQCANSPAVGTKYYSIPPAAFLPESSTLSWQQSTTIKYITAGGNSLYAPVQLPHGVTMTNFTCRVRDLSTSYSVKVEFYHWEVLIASAATTVPENPNFTVVSSPILSGHEIVNNNDARYQIRFTVDDPLCGSACAISNCTIAYTAP